MSKQLPGEPPRSRYSYRAVAQEVGRQIDRRPRGTQRSLAKAAGMDDSAFSHRLVGERSRFTIEQLGAIADALDAPPGWPFVPWELAARR